MVAGHKCRTKLLNNFINIHLKPLLCKIKSYVTDDIDILTKLCNR